MVVSKYQSRITKGHSYVASVAGRFEGLLATWTLPKDILMLLMVPASKARSTQQRPDRETGICWWLTDGRAGATAPVSENCLATVPLPCRRAGSRCPRCPTQRTSSLQCPGACSPRCQPVAVLPAVHISKGFDRHIHRFLNPLAINQRRSAKSARL